MDGPAEVSDPGATEANRGTVRAFVDQVLLGCWHEAMPGYFDGERLAQHDPRVAAGVPAWRAALEAVLAFGLLAVSYARAK